MDSCDYALVVSHAIVFQQQIFRKQEEAKEDSWSWENYLPNTLSIEEVLNEILVNTSEEIINVIRIEIN